MGLDSIASQTGLKLRKRALSLWNPAFQRIDTAAQSKASIRTPCATSADRHMKMKKETGRIDSFGLFFAYYFVSYFNI